MHHIHSHISTYIHIHPQTFSMNLPTTVNSFWKIFLNTVRLVPVSMAILNLVKLTVEISHHTTEKQKTKQDLNRHQFPEITQTVVQSEKLLPQPWQWGMGISSKQVHHVWWASREWEGKLWPELTLVPSWSVPSSHERLGIPGHEAQETHQVMKLISFWYLSYFFPLKYVLILILILPCKEGKIGYLFWNLNVQKSHRRRSGNSGKGTVEMIRTEGTDCALLSNEENQVKFKTSKGKID